MHSALEGTRVVAGQIVAALPLYNKSAQNACAYIRPMVVGWMIVASEIAPVTIEAMDAAESSDRIVSRNQFKRVCLYLRVFRTQEGSTGRH